MAGQDRVHWDERYQQKMDAPYPQPDRLLFPFTPPLRSAGNAHALDLACGVGQNGLWLAAQGYVVDLVDVSRVALVRAREEATRRHLRGVNFFQQDLDDAGLEADRYDLVVVFRFLSRKLMPQLRATVKPGGRILYQTFNTNYLTNHPEMNPDYLLHPGELTGTFGDWRILRVSETAHISQIVAMKPVR
ncbi:MAG: class I SAM-dependent methyltransferase [Chloroflexota bacterium]